MKVNVKKVLILLKKDVMESLFNRNFYIYTLIPIIFSIFMVYIMPNMDYDGMRPSVLIVASLILLSLLPMAFLTMLLVEEKERNTLRTLHLARVTLVEMYLSKMGLVLSYTMLVSFIIGLICRIGLTKMLWYLLLMLLNTLIMLFIGGIAGILMREQTTATYLTIPSMLIFMVMPIFTQLSGVEQLIKIIRFIPTSAVIEIFISRYLDDQRGIFSGEFTEANVLGNWLAMVIWLVVTAALFAVIYKKKSDLSVVKVEQ